MNPALRSMTFVCVLAFPLGLAPSLGAQRFQTSASAPANNPAWIDLPTALRLAGAQNLDIQIAVQRLAEAKANQQSAVWQFFPWLSPGVAYRRHDDLIQDVAGNILEVHKESYTVGPTVIAQVDLGEAVYRNLASRQLVKAANYALETQRQETILAAAQGYFDLVKARSSVDVAAEAVAISTNYSAQVAQATGAGIAFKGDLLRVQVQTERNLLTLRQAQEQQRLAAMRLAQTLHLDSTVELLPADQQLLPLRLVNTNTPLETLVAQALGSRPELKQSHALIPASRDANRAAAYGPLIPTLGAQVFGGGLGGGRRGGPNSFGESEDYQFTLGWRIGPGGLFDQGRIRATESRLKIARLTEQKLIDEVIRQVTEAVTHMQSQTEQMATAERAIKASDETLRLSQLRKEFGVGAVLETIQAEQDLTRARLDYLNAVAEYNKAQYAVRKAVGALPEEDKQNPADDK